MTPRSEPEAATRGRQPPAGRACELCRKNKIKCDGQQPQCGNCRDAGLVCEVAQRGVRGPKKGYIKTLRNRLQHLEALLASRHSSQQSPPQVDWNEQQLGGEDASGDEITLLTPPVEFDDVPLGFSQADLPVTSTALSASHPDTILPNNLFPDPSLLSAWSLDTAMPLDFQSPLHIVSSVHAELDQLYFDRVHPSMPILHQRRYSSWSKSGSKSAARMALQYAMWTLATLLSSQFREMTQSLYQETKRTLEACNIDHVDMNTLETEWLQAWVLLSVFESMRTYHRQAWVSAGRVFRLLQGLRYNEIDSPKRTADTGDFVDTEQKRRVFWMAFFLDHLFSVRNDWAVTLNEHVICTRLPASDADFQSGRPVLGEFPSEAIADSNPRTQSSFNECLILAAICGRTLLRVQQRNISQVYGDVSPDSSEQRWWLDGILSTRLQALSQCYPPPTQAYDPLLLFANILAQVTVVYYCNSTMETFKAGGDPQMAGGELGEYQQRALGAIANVLQLASMLRDLHYSKIHPLMPLPLFLCGEFLYTNRTSHASFELQLQEMIDIFRELRNVNNQEQSYLDLLPQSCIPTSAMLLGQTAEGICTS
ncbi:fungal-specific transcription factor domain-containing protein [Xylariaceae sp. FL0804]|nr:fungal-specific transcription factor domain-containing protein [Xylariaceae sp. FL0804]